jgi:tape measure domain-containing protein
MSNTIDQKVVEMKFDNKQFETNVQTSLSSIDKLKKSLDMKGVSKGLEGVSEASKKIDMTGLGNAVETVKARFSALEVMAVTALVNITNSAINAGKRMISSLTIDPIKTGLNEYETKLNSIQTILANTQKEGTNLATVTKALDELNTYSDKTIYNFQEMAQNIGTFTAAGVALDTSVDAIKGIANLAAISGSNAQQASTAMYQLSQALATGTVKLMDWNSVVNAGMGGQVFQDSLMETARVHGVAIDDIIKKNGSFRDSLQEGWLTSSILTETLSKFTGDLTADQLKSMGYTEEQIAGIIKLGQTASDAATKVKTFSQLINTLQEAAQSGWAQSWEIIIGNFEEAKVLFTDINNVIGGWIGASAQARNEVLQGWKDLGGRTAVIDAIRNMFEGLIAIIKPVKEAFSEIFPPMTAERLAALSEGLKQFTEKLKPTQKTVDNLKSAFKGLFAFLDIIRMAFVAIFDLIKPLFSGLGMLSGGVLGVSASFGDWMVKLRDAIKNGEIFGKVVEGIHNFVKAVGTAIKKFIDSIKEKFDFDGLKAFHTFLENMHERMAQIGGAATSMGELIVNTIAYIGEAMANSKFLVGLQKLWEGIKAIGSAIAKFLGDIFGGLFDKLGNGDFSGVFDLINSAALTTITVMIAKFIKGFKDVVETVGSIKDSVVGILNQVKDCFKAYQEQLKAGTLLKIATAIGILAASILVISLIDSEKLAGAIAALSVLFVELLTAMNFFSKIDKTSKGTLKATVAMTVMAVSILILATALKKIGELEFGQLMTGLVGVAGLAAIMVATAKLLSSEEKTILKGATQMVIFATAILILGEACKNLAELSWEELAKGVSGVLVLAGIMVATAKLVDGEEKAIIKGAANMVIFGAALAILAAVCKSLAELSWEELAKGMLGVLALAGTMVAVAKLVSGESQAMIKGATQMVIFAAALAILAAVCQDLAALSWEELLKGLAGVAGLMVILVAGLKTMPKDLTKMGVQLLVVSAALLVMSKALKELGDMGWESIAKGLIALGGAMAILVIGLNKMEGTAKGAAALLLAAAALGILVPVMSILGAMSWEAIAKGLVVLAGAFTVMGVAGKLLEPLIPAILGLSGAFSLLGVGVALIGAGLLAIGLGISALVAALGALVAIGAAGAVTIVGALGIIVRGIADLIPYILKRIGEGILELCKVIADGAPAIAEAFKAVVTALVDVLVESIPMLVEGVLVMITSVLTSLVEHTPEIVDKVFQFLIGVLEGIARNLPGLIKAAVDVLMSFLTGFIDALKSIDPNILIDGIAAIGFMAALMVALAALALLAPAAIVGVLAFGAVIAELALVLAAVGALAQIPGLTWLINEGGKLLGAIGNAIGSLIGGIIGGAMAQISAQFPQIGSDLSQFMINVQPFLDGAKSINPSMLDGVNALVGTIMLLTGANMLNGISKWFTGGASFVDFGKELVEFGKSMSQYSDTVKNVKPDIVSASANAARAMSEVANNLPKKGGVVSWFEGENSLSVFAEELAAFGPVISAYSDSVKNVKPDVVSASANAAKAMSEMAENLPKRGGVISWFEGENSLTDFATELAAFGPVISAYSDSVKNVKPDVVQASASAALAIAEMADKLPNQGGVVSWFAGDNTLSMFAEEMAKFGPAMQAYSDSVANVKPETVTASATAAQALAELANNLPNQGGVVSWFTGDNKLSAFGDNLVVFGDSMKKFGEAVSGIEGYSESITASVTAATALAEMQASLENIGGVVSWFAGEKDLASFGASLVPFGQGLKDYSIAVSGFLANEDAVTASVAAAVALGSMYSSLPNVKGVAQWFAGAPDLSGFATSLPDFGKGMKSYSESVNGFLANADAVTASVDAAVALGGMYSVLPKVGGIAKFFAGEVDLTGFATALPEFGKGMKAYSESVNGFLANADAVTASVTAATALGGMYSSLPNIKGIAQWFAGAPDLTGFASGLPTLGESLKTYSEKVEGMSDNTASITASINAAKAIAEMQGSLEQVGGVVDWFTGRTDLADFGSKLASFGESLGSYSNFIKDVVPEKITSVSSSATSLADIETAVKAAGDGGAMKTFGVNLTWFGSYLNNYYSWIKDLDTGKISAVITETNKLVAMVKSMQGLESIGAETFGKALKAIGEAGVDGFIKAFTNAKSKANKAGSDFIDSFINGVNGKLGTVNSTMSTVGKSTMTYFASGIAGMWTTVSNTYLNIVSSSIAGMIGKYADFYNAGVYLIERFKAGADITKSAVVTACVGITSAAVTGMRGEYNDFYQAGKYAVDGFCAAITKYTYLAEARARAMARAAANAAKRELDERSPSRVFYDIGDFAGVAFVNALASYEDKSYKAGANMAKSAKSGLSTAIANIVDMVDNGIDTQPTIRPVLDLTNVEAGANRISSIFGQRQAISISNRMNSAIENKEQSEGANPKGGINFTQNNYSPKALSRIDIYRQTKNQLSQVERMIES